MVNHINPYSAGNDPRLQRSNTARSDASAGRAPSSAGEAAPQTDRVNLSSGAQALHALEKRLQDVPDVDMSKVDRIKSALANGSYAIDSQKLADKLLGSDEILG